MKMQIAIVTAVIADVLGLCHASSFAQVSQEKGPGPSEKSISYSPEAAAAKVDEYLAKLSHAKDPEAKIRYLQYLHQLGPAGANKIKALEPYLADSDRKVQYYAASAITFSRPEDCQTAYKKLIGFLDENDSWFVIAAGTALGNMGKSAEPAVPHLIQAYKRKNDDHPALPNALGRIGGKNAYDFLLELTERGPTPGSRGSGATALAGMGKMAEHAIPALKNLLEISGDSDDQKNELGRQIAGARRNAARALGKIGKSAPGTAVPVLSNVIADKDSSPSVREAAMQAVQEIGAPAEAAIPALLACLKEKEHVSLASKSLSIFGLLATEPLLEFCKDKNENASNRTVAYRALERIALDHQEVYESIRAAVKDGDLVFRRLAFLTLTAYDKKKKR